MNELSLNRKLNPIMTPLSITEINQCQAFSPTERCSVFAHQQKSIGALEQQRRKSDGVLSVCHNRVVCIQFPCQWLRSDANPPSSARD